MALFLQHARSATDAQLWRMSKVLCGYRSGDAASCQDIQTSGGQLSFTFYTEEFIRIK